MTDFQQQLAFHSYNSKGYDYLPYIMLGYFVIGIFLLYKIIKENEK